MNKSVKVEMKGRLLAVGDRHHQHGGGGRANPWGRQAALAFILFSLRCPVWAEVQKVHACGLKRPRAPWLRPPSPGPQGRPRATRAIPRSDPTPLGGSFMLQLEQRKSEMHLGHAVVPESKNSEKKEKLRGPWRADIKGAA